MRDVKIGFYDVVKSTTLESNKSLGGNPHVSDHLTHGPPFRSGHETTLDAHMID